MVVFDITEDGEVMAAYAAITGSEIKEFGGKYDQWKVPLFKWRTAGLEKGSYVKANCIALVPLSTFKSEKYIGRMDRTDFKNMIRKIEKFIESGETPW